MRTERGQATVEWIGILLLVTLALAALARLVRPGDDHALASTLAHSITHPASRDRGPDRHLHRASDGQVVGIRIGKRDDSPPPGARAFTAPPLVPPLVPPSVPPVGPPDGLARLRLPDLRGLLRARPGAPIQLPGGQLPGGPALLQRVRRGASAAWRRAWYACLVYERFRWAFLHPESRFPGYAMPPAEVLRIVNDCVSPIDLVRDWPMLRNGAR